MRAIPPAHVPGSRLLGDGRLRAPTADRRRHHAAPVARSPERLRRRRHGGLVAVHAREPRAIRGRRVPPHVGRRALTRRAGRVRELQPERRRLRRSPLGDRHRVWLAVLRQPRRDLVPQPPARPTGLRLRRRSESPVDVEPAGDLHARRRVVQLPVERRFEPAGPRAPHGERKHLHGRQHGRRAPGRVVSGTGRARPFVVHGARTHDADLCGAVLREPPARRHPLGVGLEPLEGAQRRRSRSRARSLRRPA